MLNRILTGLIALSLLALPVVGGCSDDSDDGGNNVTNNGNNATNNGNNATNNGNNGNNVTNNGNNVTNNGNNVTNNGNNVTNNGTNNGEAACLEACGDGCPAPEFWVCASDGETYCNACVIGCYGLTVAADPQTCVAENNQQGCLDACGIGCPAPEFQVCAEDGQLYCTQCQLDCRGLAAAADPTSCDTAMDSCPDLGGLHGCFSNNDCPADMICENLGASDIDAVPCCIAGTRGTGAAGTACTAAADCVTAVCIEGDTAQLCSDTCELDTDCPVGMQRCISLGGEGWCFPEN